MRLAGPADAAAYVETLIIAQIATYASMMPAAYAAERRAAVPDLIEEFELEFEDLAAAIEQDREPFRWHWVADDTEQIIGVASAGSEPGWWEAEFDPPPTPWILDRLYVLPTAHGTGVGQSLLDIAVGERSAYLWIIRGNPRAERFYRRNMFVPDGSVGLAGGPWLNQPMFRMVRMRR